MAVHPTAIVEDSAVLSAEFQQQGDADGGDQRVDARLVAQRTIRQPLDQESQCPADDDRKHRARAERPPRLNRDLPVLIHPPKRPRQHQRENRPHHKDIAMRKIDELKHSIHHRVTHGDECIDRPDG